MCVYEPFTLEELNKALTRLSSKKSSGVDLLSGYFIKSVSHTMKPLFLLLFNKIMKTGDYPKTWKVAKITPVHKKGSVEVISNYRPVSNLNTLAKLFELCVLGRLEQMNMDDLMRSFQHGFRRGHGTDTAMSTLVSKITGELGSKKKVLCYSADLTAAFDLLQKEVLADIMIRKGVKPGLVKLVFNYLSDRQWFVQIGKHRSCVRQIGLGCVQGSILGPFLFNVYTSELERIVTPWHVVSYADDAYVTIVNEDLHALTIDFETTMSKHCEWLKGIGMVCNQQKTKW